MAKKKNDPLTTTLESLDPTIPRPRLSKLIIRNFRCIGSRPVEIELDDIVVLVGPNNSGKSSILRAYEVVMSQGSNQGKLTLDDFPNSIINPDELPEIELQTVVYDYSPGTQWIKVNPETGEKYVREKWIWENIGHPIRKGFDIEKNDWDDKVPWGAPNVANSRRPQPHRIDAFSNPEDQSKEIINILKSVLDERVKSFQNIDNTSDKTDYELLLDKIQEIQGTILEETKTEINKVEGEISGIIEKVFPGYEIKFDARPQDEIEKSIVLFKANPQLLMGPEGGYQSAIERQGSGARRTLLWAALKFVSESKLKAKSSNAERPHVLLLDEPELCLHPGAVREACKVLYDLPQKGNWQVMVTTHSPSFIDLSRDNTTIVRVEREENGNINGTTLFKPQKAKLEADDKARLKLLNICDPYVAEFFFGGHSIIVEGDTEYTAFKYVISQNSDKFKNVHIIRARGKDTIVSLIKILNHFGSTYSVLHDSDRPYTDKKKKNGELKKNKAWSTNEKIINAVNMHINPDKVRLLASIPNFEEAYFGEEVKGEKPYNALMTIKEDTEAFQRIHDLLEALMDHEFPLPPGCLQWREAVELQDAIDII
ncbi:ATP-dependent nuclease [Priestia megaterium]